MTDEWFDTTWAHGRDTGGRRTLLRRRGWAKSEGHLAWKEVAAITDREIDADDMKRIVDALNAAWQQ